MATNTESASGGTLGGLSPNLAAALSYLLGFVTGILFFLLSKDKYVRFHALQSIMVSIFFIALSFVVSPMMYSLAPLISITSLVVTIILIVKAYQGQKYKLPVIGDIAEKNS